MRAMIILLALAVLPLSAWAGGYVTPTNVTVGSLSCVSNATDIVLSTEGLNIAAVITFTIVVIALAYAVGNVFTNAGYIVFAKDELYHLAFSIVILAGVSGIILTSCGIIDLFFTSTFTQLGTYPSNCLGAGQSMQGAAGCYLNLTKNNATRLSQSYIKNYLDKLMDSTFAWSIQWPLLNSYTSTAGSYKRIQSNQYDIIVNSFLIPALMSISMQQIIINFISENVVQWILPAAFVLRLFIPTRQMGNMLIALVIGLYVLVPFMYVFNFSMYDIVNTPQDCQNVAGAVCDFVVDSGCGAPVQTCTNPDSFWNVARLIPVAFFLPNLTIALLVTFLSSMHKALRVIG